MAGVWDSAGLRWSLLWEKLKDLNAVTFKGFRVLGIWSFKAFGASGF